MAAGSASRSSRQGNSVASLVRIRLPPVRGSRSTLEHLCAYKFCGRNLSFCDQNYSTGVFRRAASGLSWAVVRVGIDVGSTQRAVDWAHRACTRRSEIPKATNSAELGAEMT